ncbi:uncharacterized protein BJX67DRAFT_14253 [Aspergillus lucknowensis]|uniref:Uncharacterized protein n=1 Tax=Aspergillus lucknowensis TaxID=176173 RepID=A0ABR4M7Y7_9EURO
MMGDSYKCQIPSLSAYFALTLCRLTSHALPRPNRCHFPFLHRTNIRSLFILFSQTRRCVTGMSVPVPLLSPITDLFVWADYPS